MSRSIRTRSTSRSDIPRRDGEPITLKIPILASAMDGVVDVKMAIAMGKLGGLGVLNLEGVQTRYENPDEVLAEVVVSGQGEGHLARFKSSTRNRSAKI